MGIIDQLNELRTFGGKALTLGLSDQQIAGFAVTDPLLAQAVGEALENHRQLRAEFGELLAADEPDQIDGIQSGLINFYAADTVNPFVSLAARGPWLVTTKGAVLHDSGGYGMLGLGHGPQPIIDAMSKPQVMANVMTANFSQLRLINALNAEIGCNRGGEQVFAKYLFLNSGSESVTLAARISDVNARIHTDPGARHAGKTIKVLSLRGGFHGRTDRPAQYSDSTIKTYKAQLASFRDRDNLLTVAPNDLAELRQVFALAQDDKVFIESMFMEPVMGEGDPGQAITPEFYALARELTKANDSLLLVDSIQAGLRAHGCLSMVDYPGFEKLEIPDMETYSKALNAGQYPLSVLALSASTADLYGTGVYGNTMTTNPRAMDVACAVLAAVSPQLRTNIRKKGQEFLDKFNTLAASLDGLITKVQGTGLLFSCEVDSNFRAYGSDSLEQYLRLHGIGVIHGGANSLRFTPHFAVSSAEVDLIVNAVKDALLNGPRLELALAQAG